jgi:hypothetical protein
MANGTVTWDQIRGQFTDIDVDHMKNHTGGGLDLSDCQNVHEWAQEIYLRVKEGSMPPGKPWSPEWVDNFKTWMDDGAICP